MRFPLNLFVTKAMPRPVHFINMISWNGADDAFIQRVKPHKMNRGLYPVQTGSHLRLSKALSAERTGRSAFEMADFEAFRVMRTLESRLVFAMPTEMAPPEPRVAQGLLDGLAEADIDPATVAVLNSNRLSTAWYRDHWRALGVERAPAMLSIHGCLWLTQGLHRLTPQTEPAIRAREQQWQADVARRRGRAFTSFNGRLRQIRTYVVAWLTANGWLDRGYVSLLGYGDDPPIDTQGILALPEGELAAGALEPLMARLPLELDVDKSHAASNLGRADTFAWRNHAPAPYDDSYFSIVVDTNINDDVLFITEKALKCFMNFHPFVYFGNPGALAEMRRLGFQTFHPLIDESYDLAASQHQRLQLALDEVRRLMSLSQEQLHDLYDALRERLLHNYRHAIRDTRQAFVDELNTQLIAPMGLPPLTLP